MLATQTQTNNATSASLEMDSSSLRAIKNHMENILQPSVHDAIVSLHDKMQTQRRELLMQRETHRHELKTLHQQHTILQQDLHLVMKLFFTELIKLGY